MSSMETCVKCGAPATLMCSRCFERYCSVNCQMHDWVTHKRECKEIPRLTPINSGIKPKSSQHGFSFNPNRAQKGISSQALLEAIQVLTNKFELASSKNSLQVSGSEQNNQQKQNDLTKLALAQNVNDTRANACYNESKHAKENQAEKNSSVHINCSAKSGLCSDVVSKRFFTKDVEILPLPIGKNKKLFVTDTSSIEKFLVTVIDSEQHKEMVKNLEQVVEFCKNAPKSKLGYRPQAKELCLAMFENDGKWYRACLMDEIDDLYTLYSIDCGHLAQVPRERILPFSDKLMFSTSANVCHIKNLKPESLPKLKALIAKDAHIDCDVRYVEDRRTYEIKLNRLDTTISLGAIAQQKHEQVFTEDNGKDFKKPKATVEKFTVSQKEMQSNDKIATDSNNLNSEPALKKFTYKDLQVIQLSVGSNLKLAVTDASLIDNFLLTVIEYESKYCKQLTKNLLKVAEYCKNDVKTKQNYCPQPNEMCLAIFDGDGQWYRAFFAAENPINDNYKLSFVDFGNTSLVPSAHIIPMPKELMFPTCANICLIKNIEKDDLPKLKEFLAKQNVIDCDVRYVESMDIFQININEWERVSAKSSLVKQQIENQVTVAKENVEKVEAPVIKKLTPLMQALKQNEIENETKSPCKFLYENLQVYPLSEGKNIKLIVTDTSFVENLILSVIEFGSEHRNKMAIDLKKVIKYCKNASNSKRGYSPETNELCLAIFEDDGQWYRACCIEENSIGDIYKVQFIDYGNVAKVPRGHIMPITEELMFPTCTNVCRIKNIEANDLQKLKDFIAIDSLIDCEVHFDDNTQMYGISVNAVF